MFLIIGIRAILSKMRNNRIIFQKLAIKCRPCRTLPAMRFVSFIVGAAIACLSETAGAQTAPAPVFDPPAKELRRRAHATKTDARIDIDGRLDEEPWQSAEAISDFVQTEPLQGQPATHASRVKVLFDDDRLYFGVRLDQPGGWAAFNQRDMRRDFSTDECDSFGIFIDSFGDSRNAFSFQVNPWGAQRDSQSIDATLFEVNWDTVWYSQTTRDDEGWTLEVAIPWKSLRHNGVANGWGLQFYRRERGVNEDSVFSPVPRSLTPYVMAYAGVLEGLEPPVQRKLSAQLRPYAIARVERQDNGSIQIGPGVGGEITWAPTPASVVDLTVNTDFAETDVDRRVVNLRRFSVFLPERRQFFLESSGVFTSGLPEFLQPFFSRTIGLENGRSIPIAAGARAVYRSVDRSAGLLVVDTLATDSARNSLFGVARYSHNLGEQSRVGGLLIARNDFASVDVAQTTNVVPVIDGFTRVGQVTLQGSAMGSATQEGLLASYGGAGSAEAAVVGKYGWARVNLVGISPRFRANAGFVARENIFGAGLNAGIDYRPLWLPGLVRAVGIFTDSVALWRAEDAKFQEVNIYASPAWVLFRGGDEAWFFVEKSSQVLTESFEPVPQVTFGPGVYNFERYGVSAFSQRSRKISASFEASIGRYYTAETFRGSIGASLQPIPHVQLAATWGYNRFWGQGVSGGAADTHLILLESRLAMTPRLQVIGSFQRDTAGNGNVINARLAWEFLPLSFVYLVFTDTRPAYASPAAPIPEQRLALKVAYTWRT